MMFAANTPLCLWAEAVSCAAFLINRLPSRAIRNDIPFKRWNKRLPVLDVLRPFGCLAYAYIPEAVRSSKLSPRSIRGVMVGYAPTQHAYRIFDLDSGTVVVSNNVKFDEFAFPFQSAEKVPRNFSAPKPSSVSSFFSAPGVSATLELPDTAMDIDQAGSDVAQAESDTVMAESTPMPVSDTLARDLIPAQDVSTSNEPSSDIEMSEPMSVTPQITYASSKAITKNNSESRLQTTSMLKYIVEIYFMRS